MLKRIFQKHYNTTYAYIIDVMGLLGAIAVLLQLNGSRFIINEYQDLGVFVVLAIICIKIFGGYRMMLRFTSLVDIAKIGIGLFMATSIYALYTGAYTRLEYRYLVLLFYFSMTSLVTYRILIRLLYRRTNSTKEKTTTLLYGAGENGINAQRALANSLTIEVVGFIDDDETKTGRSIEGLTVYGNKNIEGVLDKKQVKQVIITTDKLTPAKLKELFTYFVSKKVKVLTVPSVENWVGGTASESNLKAIKIEDLLRRDEIKIDLERNKNLYSGKTILVTGAAGSIGSEIVRQLLPFQPAKLILLDLAETPLFHLKNEVLAQELPIEFEFCVASVLDASYLEYLFKNHPIDLVFHAAAYKHVFMMESNPNRAILNNVLGTKNVIDAAVQNKASQVVLVSTDKAVNPSNVMGASKRIAELYLSSQMEGSATKLITTRFGNVLGSNGSVVPIFREQIANGGPVTITHPEITRFFMTIPEACQLVLEAGVIGEQGDIFVFDMGEPVKIKDLAINMIHLSGLVEDQDIKIEYTGLRPGEKLYEELLTHQEELKPSHNELIFVAKKEAVSEEQLKAIETLIEMAGNADISAEKIVAKMKELVPEFKSMNSQYEKLDS